MEGAICHLARNSYHIQLVILRSADVFIHNFVVVIATHGIYIYVAVIPLRLSYFQFCVKFMSALWYLALSGVLVLLLSPTATLMLPTSARKALADNLLVF